MLAITMVKEAVDDIKRFKWDKDINEKVYMRQKRGGGEE